MPENLTNYVLAANMLESQNADTSLTSANANTISLHGYGRLRILCNLGDATDSDTTVVLRLENSNSNSSSDLIAGALGTDVFETTITVAGSDNDSIYVIEVDLLGAGATGRYVRLAPTVSAADAIQFAAIAELYQASRVLPHDAVDYESGA